MEQRRASTGQVWRRRPVLGNLVRAMVVLGPFAFAVTVGLLVASVLPRPSTVLLRLGWSLVVMASSTLALVLAGRLARRLLPLSLLLRVGVVFPDAAPRRFGIALRAVRPGKRGDDQDPASALSLLAALLTHDRRTRGHSERVAAYALLIADELGLDETARSEVRWAGLLHDVGKIDVPPEILNKPGGLDEDEWAIMSSHPEAGAARVAPLRPWLGDAVRAVDGHHERWDGRGYPQGVTAADLPMSTRIVALADAVETMTAARSYKTPISIDEARAEVASCAGGQFDPAVARAFLGVSVPRLWRVAGPLAWLAQVPILGAVLQGSLAPGAVLFQGAALSVGQVASTAAIVGAALVTSGVTHGVPAAEPPVSAETTAVAEVVEDAPASSAIDDAWARRALPTVAGGSAAALVVERPRPTTTATVLPADPPEPAVAPAGPGGLLPGQGGVPPGPVDDNGDGVGNGDGQGNGVGSGNGSGQGNGVGSGNGSGQGNGVGSGNGSGQGNGVGSGNGSGQGNGVGSGNGSGQGNGVGSGNGSGQGNGVGSGNGSGSGQGNGVGSGNGSGQGNGVGSGNGSGQGNGVGSGNGNGRVTGTGKGARHGPG